MFQRNPFGKNPCLDCKFGTIFRPFLHEICVTSDTNTFSMNITYLLREGVSGFKRARLSMFVAIFTITISLFLLGLFASVYRNVNTIINSFREKVEMEAFLAEPITDSLALDIQYRVSEVQGVESITYISKEQAAKIFRQEFGEDDSG